MDNKFECYYSDTENLRNIYYENMASIDKFAKWIFNASIYKKKPKKNLWDLSNLEIYRWMLGSSAFYVANNNFREWDFHATLIWWNHDSSVLTWKEVAETLVFILFDDKVKLYISKAKFRYGYWAIAWWLIPRAIAYADTALNKKRREDKTLKTYVFSREDFLSRISYNSYDINKNNVSITIELDWKKHECWYLYQPYLHLFLYYIENWFEQTIPWKKLQKIFLDKYVLDMNNKPVIPTEAKEEKIKVLDEKRWNIAKTKVIVDDWKKYDEYWFDKDWYNREWFDAYWYDRDGYNRKWFNKKWYDRFWFDKEWYNKLWLDEDGYDREWYDKDWYDEDWFDKYWFNRKWINKYTWTEYDEDWFDKEGYSRGWFDRDWFNEEWYDYLWYDEEWYDKNCFNKAWINKYTWTEYDKKWYNKDWFDSDWIHKITWAKYDKNGYDKDWLDIDWYDKMWYSLKNTKLAIGIVLFLIIGIIVLLAIFM